MPPAEGFNYTQQFVRKGEIKVGEIHTHLAALGRGAMAACRSLAFFRLGEGLLKIQWLIKTTCFPWLGSKHNLNFVFPLFL